MNNLGVLLSQLGREAEALPVAKQAVQVYRQLAEANPAHHASLAAALNICGAMLSKLGRPEEALAAGEEVAQMYRRLAYSSPAGFAPNLGSSLTILSARLWKVGRSTRPWPPASRLCRCTDGWRAPTRTRLRSTWPRR